MHLDNRRDYKRISDIEKKQYEIILAKEKEGLTIRRNLYNEYPEAVKHYLSLFPNNHICLNDIKKRLNIHSINEDFRYLIHNEETNEREILKFINHDKSAFYIVGSIFDAGGFTFGHHDAYVFPEFKLGSLFRTDYLLIGKGSGGYEFIFIEFEKPNGRVALKNGHRGQIIRSGVFQTIDWKKWVDSNYSGLREFFEKEKNTSIELPDEFVQLDTTRIHYVVVAGHREDYDDTTYYERRYEKHTTNTIILHYDNLYDSAERLIERTTF